MNKKKKNDSVNAIKKSNIFFLVYDVNLKKSLDEISYWVEVIKRCKKNDTNGQNFLIVIIGNKIDLQKNCKKNSNNENIDNAKKIANDNKGIFFMTSALKNQGIKNLLGESINKYLCLSLS